jgi:importin subunit beta-1
MLCGEMENTNSSAQVRNLAGIVLKNTFRSTDEQKKLSLINRWLMLPINDRSVIRERVVNLFSSSAKEVRSCAALVVGTIAAIDYPRKLWNDFVDIMLQKIISSSEATVQETAFDVIQIVGEEMPGYLQPRSSDILNVIASCLGNPNLSNGIKLPASKALVVTLEFAENNMQNPTERNSIMNIIFTIASNSMDLIRLQAYICLVKVATLFYWCLPEYMEQIVQMTLHAINQELDSPVQDVALQALEFYSSVSDVELSILADGIEASAQEVQFYGIMKIVLPRILPALYQCLTKQSDEPGDDSWNIAAAAGNCLTLAAQVVSDDIVSMVISFVEQNIQNPNWRLKDAATLVFGAILGGPSVEKLAPLVQAALFVILSHVQDPSAHVRDTAVWTIGRICECTPKSLDSQMLLKVMEVICFCLKQPPRIASLVCWAIHNLANSFEEFSDAATSPLSPYFQTLLLELYGVTCRSDVIENNLLASSFEAMNLLILNCAQDCLPVIESLFPHLIKRMDDVFASPQDAQVVHPQVLQGYLCSSLNASLSKLSSEKFIPFADNIMVILMKMLQNQSALLYEEALMTVGAVINATKHNFSRYVSSFAPFLLNALRNVQDQQVNIIAVSVVSDLANALGENISTLCDEIILTFLQNLQSSALDRDAKPLIISCIGDLALAIKGSFPRYLAHVMAVIVQASQFQMQELDEDAIETMNALRLSILDAIVGIINGLKDGRAVDSFQEFIGHTFQFLDTVSSDQHKDDKVLNAALGLLGDLVGAFGKNSASFVNHPCVQRLVNAGVNSANPEIRESASYARSMIARV